MHFVDMGKCCITSIFYSIYIYNIFSHVSVLCVGLCVFECRKHLCSESVWVKSSETVFLIPVCSFLQSPQLLAYRQLTCQSFGTLLQAQPYPGSSSYVQAIGDTHTQTQNHTHRHTCRPLIWLAPFPEQA